MDPKNAERRLAAIMFTDIVGYTALMGQSEQKGLRVRERHQQVVQPLVERYGGEWIEETGDESLSSFPSAVDAVNCALAVQAELHADPELRLRIGIHLGETLVDGGKLYGDGVNVASRIRPLAEPGGVCISDAVYDSTRNQPNIDSSALGERNLKNVDRPVAVFSISGTASPPRPITAIASPRSQRLVPWAVLALAAALLASLGWWLNRPASEVGAIRSIAVLPLNNLSGDPEQDYFTDGMTEALIAELGKIRALQVTSRTSIMRYKESDKPLAEIARELGVEAVVEGSVLRAGDRVRITAQLVHAPVDRHLWAESYERDIRDVLAIQGDVARAVAREVRIELTPGERLRLSTAAKTDTRAYEAYLKGRFFLNRRHTIDGYRKAIEYFQAALEHDPTSALAHSGLADAYSFLTDYGEMRPVDALPRARAAATRALELDDGLAEAHTSLARVRFWFEWDWAGAEAELQRAIDLNPSYRAAHTIYGDLLNYLGRGDEGLAEMQRAVKLDPLSLGARINLAQLHVAQGRLGQAVEQILTTLDLDPDYVFGNLWLGLVYSHQSKHDQAVLRLERAVKLSGQARALWPELGYVYARAGRTDDARELMARAEELSTSHYVLPTLMAAAYSALGDAERMFDWLERGYSERDWILLGIGWRPEFDAARSDPRFQDLMRRIGLPESRADAGSPRSSRPR